MSANKLNVKAGRYGKMRNDEWNRCCDEITSNSSRICQQTTRSSGRMSGTSCWIALATLLREQMSMNQRAYQVSRGVFAYNKDSAVALGRYVKKIWEERFPKAERPKKNNIKSS